MLHILITNPYYEARYTTKEIHINDWETLVRVSHSNDVPITFKDISGAIVSLMPSNLASVEVYYEEDNS